MLCINGQCTLLTSCRPLWMMMEQYVLCVCCLSSCKTLATFRHMVIAANPQPLQTCNWPDIVRFKRTGTAGHCLVMDAARVDTGSIDHWTLKNSMAGPKGSMNGGKRSREINGPYRLGCCDSFAGGVCVEMLKWVRHLGGLPHTKGCDGRMELVTS